MGVMKVVMMVGMTVVLKADQLVETKVEL